MTNPKRPRGFTPERQLFEFLICLVLTVALFRTWHLENFVVPSGSMATTLLGVHRSLTCADCGHPFACGSGEIDGFPAPDARATCPNCGSTDNALGSAPDIPGDRLLVSKQAFRLRPPRRWEVAVFRRPDIADQVFVKRVAGLPGESIQIRGGDVYAEGEIQRKSLDEQRAVAILLHDNQHQPQSLGEAAQRWRGDESATLWRPAANGFFHPAETGPRQSTPDDERGASRVDWLTYRHWRRAIPPASGVGEAPVEDDYGYNQTRPVEEPAEVVDLLLACEVRAFGRGDLLFFATDGRDQFVVRIEPRGRRFALEHNGRDVATAMLPDARDALFGRATQVEMSIFDRQVLVALDGELVLEPYPIPPSQLPRTTTLRPLAIGSRGLGLEVTELRVYRDIYYTHPRGPYSRWALDQPYQLGNDEYFLLGDNSPLSEDSRFWPLSPAVPGKLLVGKPLMVHLPNRISPWKRGPVSVPDFSAIRYIR